MLLCQGFELDDRSSRIAQTRPERVDHHIAAIPPIFRGIERADGASQQLQQLSRGVDVAIGGAEGAGIGFGAQQPAAARCQRRRQLLGRLPTPEGVLALLLVALVLVGLWRPWSSLDDTVDLLARMGVAMSDAFVGCWHEKYVHNLVRPITYIRKHIDPKWEPLLNTPPFPEYPSGHSVVSGAMGTVMTAFFGDNYAFEDKTGSPDGRNPRHYKSFNEAADEAGISRLYGGIHFRAAIEDGLAQGRCIGDHAVALKTRRQP